MGTYKFVGIVEDTTGETVEASEAPTQGAVCGIASCSSTELVDGAYCKKHQLKTCDRFLKDGDMLIPCDNLYRESCEETHYKVGPCPCTAGSSSGKECRNCGHYHDRGDCGEMALVPDNRSDETFE